MIPPPFRAPLAEACRRFGIDTPARLAAFEAQCRVETADWTRFEENLRYRTAAVLNRTFSAVKGLADAQRLIDRGPEAIANRVYAGRLGNGPEASGDGWRYRGRGIHMLTGAANYRDAGKALNRPYIEQPDLVALPADACLTAAWFWHTKGCSALADAEDWDGITRKINGPGMLQADLRRQYTLENLA